MYDMMPTETALAALPGLPSMGYNNHDDSIIGIPGKGKKEACMLVLNTSSLMCGWVYYIHSLVLYKLVN